MIFILRLNTFQFLGANTVIRQKRITEILRKNGILIYKLDCDW